MRADIVTLFPEMFAGPFGDSILKRAIDGGLLEVHFTQLRDFAYDKHHQVDDSPFGGGSGMVLKPEPMFRAVRSITDQINNGEKFRVLLMDPAGEVFTQKKAKELAEYQRLVFICGHYEGYDARITEYLADEALSIGDYVLTGGELPAMVIIDAVARMLPGVLGSEESAPTDSFYEGILEHPQYTRPREFEGMAVPEVLFSGDHGKIRRWRREQALRLTRERRPELLEKAELSDEDRKILCELSGKMNDG